MLKKDDFVLRKGSKMEHSRSYVPAGRSAFRHAGVTLFETNPEV